MPDWRILERLFAPGAPKFPGARRAWFDKLTLAGATMGTVYLGRQGTGKTTSLARHVVQDFRQFPDRAIFVLDWSGGLSDAILSLIVQEPKEVRDGLLNRVVYDEMAHPEWVVPLPEFSGQYGSNDEEQVQRVAGNLARLAPELVVESPFLAGLGLREVAPQIFRLLTSVRNEHGETWQITEVRRLLAEPLLAKRIATTYGQNAPQARWFVERVWSRLSERERELRSYALSALLGTLESPPARARLGHPRPGWTPRAAIQRGLMVLVNGARLISQPHLQHYLFTQAYSLIMSQVSRRVPGDPEDKPISLVMDEVYSLVSIPGMAKEIGTLAPLYRSRKLQLYIVLQALSQLANPLRQQIWSLGNVVCFALADFQEAYEVAQQLFPYDPARTKLAPRTETERPFLEPDRGQYVQIANEIQRLQHRECIVRRYLSESRLDPYLIWVPRTRSVPHRTADITVAQLKEELIRKRGIPVRDALEEVERREQTAERPSPPAI